MAKWVNVSAIRYQNHPNDVRKGRDRVMEIWELLIDNAGLDKPDILLLPEYFMGSTTSDTQVETVPGEGPVQNFWRARPGSTILTSPPACLRTMEPVNWPIFTAGLVQRGLKEAAIRKIIGGNVMRVLKRCC